MRSSPQAFSRAHVMARGLWGLTWALLFRPSPRWPGFWAWRRLLLRLFGARVGQGAMVYPSARIWAPWNLTLGKRCRIGPDCDVYSVDSIVLEEGAWVSQYSYLCSASHDPRLPGRPLISGPILIGKEAWVAADVFIGPGVNIGAHAVVGARASIFKAVEAWTIVAGNPARVIGNSRRRTPAPHLPRPAASSR